MLKGDIKKGKASDTLKKRVTIGDEIYHVRTVNQKEFLEGKSDLHMMDIRPLTKVEQEVSAQTGEDVAVEEDVTVTEGGDVGVNVIEKLELAANAGESYESAKARIEKEEGTTFRELIRQRLEEEYQLFRQILKNTDALNLVDKRITDGLKTAKGNATSKAVNNSMNLLNLKRGNSDYNLKQIF